MIPAKKTKNQNKKEVIKMTKKRNSTLSIVASIALAMVLCLAAALPAMAAEPIYSSGTDADNPAQAAITKVLKMPANTTVPKGEFIFRFDKVGMNDPLDDSKKAGMPDINNVTINFVAGVDPAGGTFIVGETKYAVKESENFLAGLIGENVWKNGEGTYKYTVSENYKEPAPAKNSSIEFDDPTKEGVRYSEAIYDVEIWVEKDNKGKLFPKYVAVKIKKGSSDEYYWVDGEPGDEAEKVNPKPGGAGVKPGDPASIENSFSQVIFTNRYWKNIGGGEVDPTKTALEIVKNVTGNGSSIEDYFTFKVTLIKHAMIPDGTPVKPCLAYILDEKNNIIKIDPDKNYSGIIAKDKNNKDCIEFYYGDVLTVNLKHGQRLAFVNLYVGTLVKVVEAGDTKYTPKYKRTFSKVENIDEFVGEAGKDWGFPLVTNIEDKGPHYIEDGANKNIVTFINVRTGATPMGISTDNLPFIVLIGIGLCALAGFTVFRARRNARYYAQED